jgi:hypothetical protein
MFWSKKTKTVKSLPWYRSPKYKGDLTEEEKRELDSFRFREERDDQQNNKGSKAFS